MVKPTALTMRGIGVKQVTYSLIINGQSCFTFKLHLLVDMCMHTHHNAHQQLLEASSLQFSPTMWVLAILH